MTEEQLRQTIAAMTQERARAEHAYYRADGAVRLAEQQLEELLAEQNSVEVEEVPPEQRTKLDGASFPSRNAVPR